VARQPSGVTGGRHATTAIPGLATLLASQAGLARRAQLRELGIVRQAVANQVAAGRWRMVAPEVVSVDNGRLDFEQLLWRAALHAPLGWVAGRSALAVHGLTGYAPRDVHLLTPRISRPLPLPGVVLHVSGRLPEGGSRSASGLPVTTAARATVDAVAWETRPRAAAGLALAVVQQGLARPEDIAQELAVAGRVRHRAVLREALGLAADGADSVAEVDVLRLVRRAGLPEPGRQVRILGRRHDLAVLLPDGRTLVIEVDGPQHESPEARWADAAHDADLAAAGVVVLRIPAYAVRHHPDEVVARLREIWRRGGQRARCVISDAAPRRTSHTWENRPRDV
jgi:very-short-patch-repair endonuclease